MKEIGRATKVAYCSLLALLVLLGGTDAWDLWQLARGFEFGSQGWANEAWVMNLGNVIFGVPTLVGLSAACIRLLRSGNRTWRRLGYVGFACGVAFIAEIIFIHSSESAFIAL
jgi:hypothetical protein